MFMETSLRGNHSDKDIFVSFFMGDTLKEKNLLSVKRRLFLLRIFPPPMSPPCRKLAKNDIVMSFVTMETKPWMCNHAS